MVAKIKMVYKWVCFYRGENTPNQSYLSWQVTAPHVNVFLSRTLLVVSFRKHAEH